MTKKQLLDRIYEWERSDDKRDLYEVLGWTWEEYGAWVDTGQIPKRPTPAVQP